MTATADRAARLRRSLRRLGYDLKDGERRGRFHIVQDGAKVDANTDLFGLDLAAIEAWIRRKAKQHA